MRKPVCMLERRLEIIGYVAVAAASIATLIVLEAEASSWTANVLVGLALVIALPTICLTFRRHWRDMPRGPLGK